MMMMMAGIFGGLPCRHSNKARKYILPRNMRMFYFGFGIHNLTVEKFRTFDLYVSLCVICLGFYHHHPLLGLVLSGRCYISDHWFTLAKRANIGECIDVCELHYYPILASVTIFSIPEGQSPA